MALPRNCRMKLAVHYKVKLKPKVIIPKQKAKIRTGRTVFVFDNRSTAEL